MRTKYKPWAEPYILEHKEVNLSLEEIATYDDFCLEIGSGKGQFIASMALNHPEKTFVGIEKNVTCAGYMCKKLVEQEIQNARMMWGDASYILPSIKEKSVSILFLNFSDPWPKKRHHKRRLTSVNFLEEYHRILKDDGKIIFKTDNIDLFNDSLFTIKESGFKILSVTNDYDGLDPFDEQTEYEISFREEGVKINRVVIGK